MGQLVYFRNKKINVGTEAEESRIHLPLGVGISGRRMMPFTGMGKPGQERSKHSGGLWRRTVGRQWYATFQTNTIQLPGGILMHCMDSSCNLKSA